MLPVHFIGSGIPAGIKAVAISKMDQVSNMQRTDFFQQDYCFFKKTNKQANKTQNTPKSKQPTTKSLSPNSQFRKISVVFTDFLLGKFLPLTSCLALP